VRPPNKILEFDRQSIAAMFIDPAGQMVIKSIEIRTCPITGPTSHIAFSRINRIILAPC